MVVTADGGQANGANGARAGGRPTLGRAGAWARDLAIVGAATSFLAGYGVARQLRPGIGMVVGAGVGAVVGALFGVAFRRLLLAWLRLPILAWIPISLALGALLGGAIGVVTPLVTGDAGITDFTGVFGAFAGALQLAWFWLPYAVRAGRGKSTWPVVAAAVVLGGAIGYAALWLMFAIVPIHVD